jgi:hypothetical protein
MFLLMRPLLLIILLFVGAALIFYLSWLPDPQIGLSNFVPDWIAEWADAKSNETIRTSVPFIFLGLLIGFWLLRGENFLKQWLLYWLLLIAIVLVAELGQLFLPNRIFDWRDVAWGACGAAGGMSLINILYRLKAFLIKS